HKDCLIYEKRTDIDGNRDQKLQEFLDEIGKVEGEITVRWFNSLEELSEGVKEDIARWQAQKIRELRELNVRREDTEPIPVVFHLSSWAAARQPLQLWLEDELSGKYRIPRRVSSNWLEHHRLLLLLDGLDEMSGEQRVGCVEVINQFIKEIGLPGL